MKKLVISAAVFGLVGLTPVAAHEQTGVKCGVRFLGVDQVGPGDSPYEDGHQIVKTKPRITNNTDRNLRPLMEYLLIDSNGDVINPSIHYIPGRVKPGVKKSAQSWDIVPADVVFDHVRITACHRKTEID